MNSCSSSSLVKWSTKQKLGSKWFDIIRRWGGIRRNYRWIHIGIIDHTNRIRWIMCCPRMRIGVDWLENHLLSYWRSWTITMFDWTENNKDTSDTESKGQNRTDDDSSNHPNGESIASRMEISRGHIDFLQLDLYVCECVCPRINLSKRGLVTSWWIYIRFFFMHNQKKNRTAHLVEKTQKQISNHFLFVGIEGGARAKNGFLNPFLAMSFFLPNQRHWREKLTWWGRSSSAYLWMNR